MSGFSLLDAVTIRASSALTSSFVAATPHRFSVRGYKVGVAGIYTRGASGGYPELEFYWSKDGNADGSTSWTDPTLNTDITTTAPTYAQSFGANRWALAAMTNATSLRFLGPQITRPDGVDYLHVWAREGSGLANGTLALFLLPEIELQ